MDNSAKFEPEVVADPIALFRRWFDDASQTEPNDPNAMALATANANGIPSVRIVLMKRLDEQGFAFYTNAESQKGHELLENQHAALCFHWKSKRRQIRVEGDVQLLSPEDADEYFHSRSRKSQISAAVSEQSRPLASRELLEQRAKDFAAEHPDVIPRPDYWRGFVVAPQRIEFWEDGEHRLHNRVVFMRDGEGWTKERLYP
jgi:pyridoxamine 5'-phosphate oxidase